MSAYALPNLFLPPPTPIKTENVRTNSDEAKECFAELNSELNQVNLGKPILTQKIESSRSNVTKSSDVDVQVERVIFEPIFRRGEAISNSSEEIEDESYKPFRFVSLVLAISSYGRHYVAKRPFRNLLKLRADLVHECETMGKSNCDVPELPSSNTTARTDDDPRPSTLSKFPVARSGYCMLQHMIRDYRPLIQVWFGIICEKFSMSRKFAIFLWEPLNISHMLGDRILPPIFECSEWEEEKKEDDMPNEKTVHFPRLHKMQSFLASRRQKRRARFQINY